MDSIASERNCLIPLIKFCVVVIMLKNLWIATDNLPLCNFKQAKIYSGNCGNPKAYHSAFCNAQQHFSNVSLGKTATFMKKG